jgi:streptogramin lyase
MRFAPVVLKVADRSGNGEVPRGSRRHRRTRSKPVLELLETRAFLAAVTEFPTLSTNALPAGVASGIVAVPGGNIWFTEPGVNKIGEITTSGVATDYAIPTPASSPQGITFGPDGNLWFTEAAANKIGVINTSGVVIAQYTIPTTASNPQGITAGPDGNLWFTQAATGQIASINPSSGQITEHSVPTPGGQPEGITAGPDGNLWFTEPGANQIGAISPSTGTFHEYSIQMPGGRPQGITTGPDGNIWFTEAGAARIGTISLSTGTVTNYPVPTPGGVTEGITTGSDGNLWFTEPGTAQVGRITPSGVVTEFATNTTGSQPWGITTGPDGNLWFTDTGASKVGQVALAQLIQATGVPVIAQAGSPFTATIATFTPAAVNPQTANFTATIDWGDGSAATPGIITAGAQGTFNVSATKTYATAGTYQAQITVSDHGGAIATASSTITVAYAATGVNFSAVEGQVVNGQVASFSDPQTTGQVGQYSAMIAWGDSTTSIGVVSYSGGTAFTVTGSHTYTEEGVYPVTVTVTGPSSRTFLAYGQATVADAPLSAVATTNVATTNVPFTGVVATFSDEDPNGTASDYQATIVWGDGHTSVGTIIPPTAPNSFFSVSGTNTYMTAGPYTVKVTISDIGGATATASSSITVAYAASGNNINAVEGQLFNGQVASFSDPQTIGQAGQYSAIIAWGDGTTSSGVITYIGGSTVFTVSGSHTYAEEGVYPAKVTVAGPNNETFLAYAQAVVADAPLSAVATTNVATTNVPFTGVVATFSDEDPNGTASDYQATIVWGDGHKSIGTIGPPSAPGGNFSVSGTNTYMTSGTFPVQVTINDVGGATTTVSSTITAAYVATGSNISAVEGQFFNEQVASFSDPQTTGQVGQYSAIINWGDSSPTTSGVITYSGGTAFTVSGSHTYAEEGAYPVMVTVTGPSNRTFLANSQAVVLDAPLHASAATILPTAGVPFTGVVATFSDDDPMGTVSDYQATIVWGDGNTSAGIIAAPANTGYFTVTGSNTYAAPGSYPLQVTINDIGGSSVTTSPSTVSVGNVPVSISGNLNPASISGPSKNLNITNVNRPTFEGMTTPFSMVQLFAQAANSNPTVVMSLGQTMSGPDGAWSLTAPTLPDGIYTVTASITGQDGFPTPPVLIVTPANPLVIDTVAPRVSGLAFDPKTGMITVVISAAWTGLDTNSLMNPGNYVLVLKRGLSGHLSQSASLGPAISGFYTGAESATLQFQAPLAPGHYLFMVKSGGVMDDAGNALDGEFTGKLPSGNGQPGGNFIVQITVPKHPVSKPHGPRPSKFRSSLTSETQSHRVVEVGRRKQS